VDEELIVDLTITCTETAAEAILLFLQEREEEGLDDVIQVTRA